MENAKLYTTANTMQRTDAEEVILQFISSFTLKSGARVLDIGCGSGDVTAEVLLPNLPQDLEQVIGIDVSEIMVCHAQNSYGNNHRLSFFQLDIEDGSEDVTKTLLGRMSVNNNNVSAIPNIHLENNIVKIFVNGLKLEDCDANIFDDSQEQSINRHYEGMSGGVLEDGRISSNSMKKLSQSEETILSPDLEFDAAFSFYCLHWVQNQKQALKNIYKLLKPSGETLLVFLASSPVFTLYEHLAKMPQWSNYMKDVGKFISPYHNSEDPVVELSNLASAVGFTNQTITCEEKSYIYQEAIALKDALKAVNPFYSRLPEEKREEYLSDCLHLVNRFHLAEEVADGLRVSYNLLIAHFRKENT